MSRTRILLFSEGITLAQIVRLVTLGRALDQERYEVSFACADFDELAFGPTSFRKIRVHSLDPMAVLKAVRSGRRLYDTRTLLAQVNEDLTVFKHVRPDLVVGDFRWSLAVSAKLYGVPHAALINAYWSPYAVREGFPVPDHPIVKILGEQLTERYFPIALPRVFAHFAEPLNAVRRSHGLAPVGSLLEVLTHGDYVLYADPPELVPTSGAPKSHQHIGYVPWAPERPLPPFWRDLPADRPVVYATVGSSGSIDTLPLVIEALGRMPVTGLVATAGRKTLSRLPDNVHVADFLPGDQVARRASLVISNGGSSTSYQALAEGVPVLGLPSNLDQYLAMTAIESAGAGVVVRARAATASAIRDAAQTVLMSRTQLDAAKKVQKAMIRTSSARKFREFVQSVALVLLLLGCFGPGTAYAESAERPRAVMGEIRFTSRVPGSGGRVICALFRESGWLKKPAQVSKAALRRHEATCVFASVPAGTYAIVAFHDENSNGDIDTNFIGLPTEDWCTSRNAKAIFGPPSFSAAKFVSRAGIVRLSGAM